MTIGGKAKIAQCTVSVRAAPHTARCLMGNTAVHQTSSQISRNNRVTGFSVDDFHSMQANKFTMLAVPRNPLLRAKFADKCFAAYSVAARCVLSHFANVSGEVLLFIPLTATMNVSLGLSFGSGCLDCVYANGHTLIVNTTH